MFHINFIQPSTIVRDGQSGSMDLYSVINPNQIISIMRNNNRILQQQQAKLRREEQERKRMEEERKNHINGTGGSNAEMIKNTSSEADTMAIAVNRCILRPNSELNETMISQRSSNYYECPSKEFPQDYVECCENNRCCPSSMYRGITSGQSEFELMIVILTVALTILFAIFSCFIWPLCPCSAYWDSKDEVEFHGNKPNRSIYRSIKPSETLPQMAPTERVFSNNIFPTIVNSYDGNRFRVSITRPIIEDFEDEPDDIDETNESNIGVAGPFTTSSNCLVLAPSVSGMLTFERAPVRGILKPQSSFHHKTDDAQPSGQYIPMKLHRTLSCQEPPNSCNVIRSNSFLMGEEMV
ncbi:hypothetical protein RDWZM_010464 [Blomia tropicalis]|uniref:Uncharacterized protein n=1 Tax=Blomia tropicalis TaxID=40697 RepID=A0A9Q0RIQ2_BLOTA|nr:hypothetical protein RDWZM_010464 [Blomia tropicalis]